MATLDEINCNELVIVARHQGEVSSWKAWKCDIVAFNDPQLWRDTSRYGAYFERIEDDAWTMAGYGVIVMDLDRKIAWSFNDYSSPWSFMLPNPAHYEVNPAARTALLALLAEPSAWNDVALTVHKRSLLGRGETSETTLAAVLDAGLSAQEALARLETRDGEIRTKDGKMLVLRGRHVPQGWTIGCEIGQDGPDGLMQALETWQATGWPAPASWDGFDHFMANSEIPFEDADFKTYLLDAEDEVEEVREDMIQAHGLAERYRACKAQWTESPVQARPKGPSVG